MLCLSKNTDYALTALAFLVERPGRVSCAREIAEAHDLPLPLLMKILKRLHRRGVLHSTRGAKGGYVIAMNLERVSLYDLLGMLEKEGRSVDEHLLECSCDDHHPQISRARPEQGPFQAFYYKLVQFLKDVRLSDLVMPGRRIDVPLEKLQDSSKHRVASNRRMRAEPSLVAGVVGS